MGSGSHPPTLLSHLSAAPRSSKYLSRAPAAITSSLVGAVCGHSVSWAVAGVGTRVAGRRSVLAPGNRIIAHLSLLRYGLLGGAQVG